MTQAPAVSVIIPCHDLGAYLDEAVDSVLEQSFQDFEILIVDDGSQDPATVRLLSEYQRPKTTVYRTGNQGLGAARNYLIERASGEYLCALDADDRLHPDYFAKALTRFEQDPSLTFVSSWLEAFGDEEWVWRQDRCDLPALLAENTVCTAALVRRNAVLAAGGYDEAMPHQGDEDWELWLRLVAAGCRGTIIPEVLFFYRRRTGSMSLESDHGRTHLSLVNYIVAKHRDHYRRHLLEALLWKERHIGDLLLTNDRIERESRRLEADLERRRAEVVALREKLGTIRLGNGVEPGIEKAMGEPRVEELGRRSSDEEYDALAGECARARAEVLALRGSWSWRITAPLRALYRLLRVNGRTR